jgi:hypothetical protein
MQTLKFTNGPSLYPKFDTHCKVEGKLKSNNFPIGGKFKFQTKFELKIKELNYNGIWFEF